MTAYGYNTLNPGQITTTDTLAGKVAYNTNIIPCQYYDLNDRNSQTGAFNMDDLETLA